MRRRIAVPVLLVSLVSMVVTAIHNFTSANGLHSAGGTGAGCVLVIFLIALGLWLYARAMAERGVLA